MSRSIGLAHIIRESDGAATGVWGLFTLRSAFQSIFAFRNGKLSVAAFEGLARPFRDGQPLSPGVFFGMVPAPDRLHVETLLRTIHLLNAGAFLPADASIFINLDPSVLTERAIADAMLREMRLVLHEAGIEPKRVVCEVTEHRLSSTSSFFHFLDSLRASGLRIAVDDYGAADSDIERIRAVKPDIVKFDAKWITRLMESGPGFALLSAMVENFRTQNIATVFEGIEEGWQLDLAERAGATMVQGFVLSRPEIVSAPVPPSQPAATWAGDAVALPSSPAAVAHVAKQPERVFGRRGAVR